LVFSESLAARARDVLAREKNISEKKMFGGQCFLLHGKLLIGVFGDALLVRLGTEGAQAALTEPHVRQMDMGARPMKGWVIVEPEGVDTDRQLAGWIERAVEFVMTIL